MLSRPLVAVSTKAYFGVERTRTWVGAVAALGPHATGLGVELAVLPTYPSLESTADRLAGTGIAWGAQDCAPQGDGAQTGAVLAATLAELGCRYVAVGHAERRSRFGEDDAMVRDKVCQVVQHGMVPLLCVGEPVRADPDAAVVWCIDQMRSALCEMPGVQVVVAYEPVWAIGAQRAAAAEHVVHVAAALREVMAACDPSSRLLYGGSAAPGTATALGSAVDGLFLGRFAHDVNALRAVLDEVAQPSAPVSAAPDRSTGGTP